MHNPHVRPKSRLIDKNHFSFIEKRGGEDKIYQDVEAFLGRFIDNVKNAIVFNKKDGAYRKYFYNPSRRRNAMREVESDAIMLMRERGYPIRNDYKFGKKVIIELDDKENMYKYLAHQKDIHFKSGLINGAHEPSKSWCWYFGHMPECNDGFLLLDDYDVGDDRYTFIGSMIYFAQFFMYPIMEIFEEEERTGVKMFPVRH